MTTLRLSALSLLFAAFMSISVFAQRPGPVPESDCTKATEASQSQCKAFNEKIRKCNLESNPNECVNPPAAKEATAEAPSDALYSCEFQIKGLIANTNPSLTRTYNSILDSKKKRTNFDADGKLAKENGDLKSEQDKAEKDYKNEANANINDKKKNADKEATCSKWQTKLGEIAVKAGQHFTKYVAADKDASGTTKGQPILDNLQYCRNVMQGKYDAMIKKISEQMSSVSTYDIKPLISDSAEYKSLIPYETKFATYMGFSPSNWPTEKDVGACMNDAATMDVLIGKLETLYQTVAEKIQTAGGAARAAYLTKQAADKAAADLAAAAKKAADDKAAAAAKKILDDANAAKIAVATQKQADADKANPANRLKACLDKVVAQRSALGDRVFDRSMGGIGFTADFKARYDPAAKRVDDKLAYFRQLKELTPSDCEKPWPELEDLEKLVAETEKKVAEDKAKAAAAAQAKLDADVAKAQAEFKVWRSAHPENIPGSCKTACTARHAGEGPKEKECERLCAVSEESLKSVADTVFVQGFDAALEQLGVSKKLCEAAKSQAADILEKANEPIIKLSDQIKEKSKEACEKAGGSAARCNFVGRLVKAVSDARECTNTAGSLNKSLTAASNKLAANKKLIEAYRDKAAKGDKESQKILKDAAADSAKEGASACESPKASDMISSIMKPCFDAAEGAIWLTAHAGDYSNSTGDPAAAAKAKADADAKAKAAAATMSTIAINTATYGATCKGSKNTDVAAKVKSACDGKAKCSYTVSAGVLGDTAPGCAKAFEATYTCRDKGNRTQTLAAEANNKVAEFDCTK